MYRSREGIVLVVAAFIINVVFLGITFNYNILHLEFQEHFNATVSETGIPGAVSVGIINLATPLTTLLCKFAGYRPVVTIGVIICGTSLIASTFVSQIHVLIFSYGILYGLGSSFVGIPPLHLLVHHFFGKRYNQACVFVLTGIGAGIAITSPLLEKSFSVYGLQNTLRIYGTCVVCIGLLGSIATRLPVQNPHESHQSISSKTIKHNINNQVSNETFLTTQSVCDSKHVHITQHHATPIHTTGTELKSKNNSIEGEGESHIGGPLNRKRIYLVDGEKVGPCQDTDVIADTGLNAEERTLFIVEESDSCCPEHSKIDEIITETPDTEHGIANDGLNFSQSGTKTSTLYVMKNMLKSFDFWLCQPMFFLYSIAITFSFVSLGNFMDEKGMTSQEIARTVSFMGFTDLATRFLFVFFVNYIPVSVTVVITIMNLALFAISMLLSLNFSNTFVKALLIGMSSPRALLLALVLPVCVELFGKQLSAEAMSVAYFLLGMGSIVSQCLTDTLYESTDSYKMTLHMCAALYVISAVSFGFAVFRSRRRRNKRLILYNTHR